MYNKYIMSGRGTSRDSGPPRRTALERTMAGETMIRDTTTGMMRFPSPTRSIGTNTVPFTVATRSIGTQTDDLRSSLIPVRNKNALATGGASYLSFLQKVYGAESESELVLKFQKELGLEPQGLYSKPVMYRQSTQIMKGLQKSRDPCHFSTALFGK